MSHDDLPLFAWTPPRKVIPFPARFRIGHARKIAVQLAKARSQREADHVLSRAIESFSRHLQQADIPAEDLERERLAYLEAIDNECNRVNSCWRPKLEPASDNSGGAA